MRTQESGLAIPAIQLLRSSGWISEYRNIKVAIKRRNEAVETQERQHDLQLHRTSQYEPFSTGRRLREGNRDGSSL